MNNGFEHNLMAGFMGYLSPEPLYTLGFEIASWVSVVLAPILLALALSIRAAGDTVNAISGKTHWIDTLRDLVLAILSWGAYLSFMVLVKGFFDVLDEGFGKTQAYQNIFEQMALLTDTSELDNFSLRDIPSSISLVFTYLFFFLTYLASLGVFCFLNLGHAALFSIAFIWGIIAITVSVSKYANIMRGWYIMMAVVFVWPLIEGLLFYFAGSLIEAGATQAQQYMLANGTEYGAKTFIYGLWGILNCLMMALAFSAPFVAYALLSNSGSVAGAVASFGLAGVAAGGGLAASLASQGAKGLGKLPNPWNTAKEAYSSGGNKTKLSNSDGVDFDPLASSQVPKANIQPPLLTQEWPRLESGYLQSRDRQSAPPVISLGGPVAKTTATATLMSSYSGRISDQNVASSQDTHQTPPVEAVEKQAPKVTLSPEEQKKLKARYQQRRGVMIQRQKKANIGAPKNGPKK